MAQRQTLYQHLNLRINKLAASFARLEVSALADAQVFAGAHDHDLFRILGCDGNLICILLLELCEQKKQKQNITKI